MVYALSKHEMSLRLFNPLTVFGQFIRGQSVTQRSIGRDGPRSHSASRSIKRSNFQEEISRIQNLPYSRFYWFLTLPGSKCPKNVLWTFKSVLKYSIFGWRRILRTLLTYYIPFTLLCQDFVRVTNYIHLFEIHCTN